MTHDCRLPGCSLPDLVAAVATRRRRRRRPASTAAHQAAAGLTAGVLDDLRAGTDSVVVELVRALLAGKAERWGAPLVRLAVEVLWHDGAVDRGSRDELASLLDDRRPVAVALLERPGLVRHVVGDVEPPAVALYTTLRRWAAEAGGGEVRTRLAAVAVSLVPTLVATGVGETGPIRPPRDDAERAAFVRRVGPRRRALEQALDADPEDLWNRLLLGLLLHCEGSAEAAVHLEAVAARLAAQRLASALVADLRFHAGLARLRRLEGAGEADGDRG